MKRILCLLLTLLLLLGAALAEQRVFRAGEIEPFGPDEALLELYVVPLIGADAMILRCGGEVMAVDVGKLNHDQEFIDMMNAIGENHLTRVFNSHPHDDHCLGMLNLTKSDLSIDEYVTAFPLDHHMEGSVQGMVLHVVKEAGIPVSQVKDGDVFFLGGARFTCMQHHFKDGNINNSSCVLLVEYGQTSLLLTGDIDVPGQSMLIEEHPQLNKVDIMKAPHHGLAYLQYQFINRVNPELVFFTNGSGSAGPGMERLNQKKIPYVFSSRGPISMVSNGDHWIVTQELYDQFKGIQQ